MLFGWERLSRIQHFLVTCLTAIGTNLSALWILVANGFMQDPSGATFNPLMMRLELESFAELFFSEDAQDKFVHTVAAGYVTGAFFVMGISAWYLWHKRHIELASRSFRMASVYGLLACIAVIALGDALGFVDGETQPMKLAAMEALWETEEPPAPLNLVAFPDQEERRNLFDLQVPWVLTPLVTHTLDEPIPGIKELVAQNRQRVVNGIPAQLALQRLAQNPHDAQALEQFRRHEHDVGYARLLMRYAPDLEQATPADIDRAAWDTVPQVSVIFWAFHFMFYMGMAMLAFAVLAVVLSFRNRLEQNRWFLRLSVWLVP
jgi:cytochrome d ubiquinol oxidase subunit I